MDDKSNVSSDYKEIARGSFWGLLGNVFFKLVSFFYIVLIARMASQNDIGLFELAFSILSFIAIFSDLGLSSSLKRYIPYFIGRGEQSKIYDIVMQSIKITAICGISICFITFFLSNIIGDFYQNPNLPSALSMLVVFILLNNFQRMFSVILIGFMDIKNSQLVTNVQNLSKFVFTIILFLFFGATLFTLTLSFILSFIPSIFLGLLSLIKMVRQLPKEGTRLLPGQLLHEIIPFGLTVSLVTSLYLLVSSSGLMILGYMTEPDQANSIVAIYSLSITIPLAITVFAYSIGGILLPILSKLIGKSDLVQVNEVIEMGQRWSIIVTFPIAIALIAFSSDIIRILYGDSYIIGAPVMSAFTIGVIINAIYHPMLLAIAAFRKVMYELRISVFAAFANVAFAAALIPFAGMSGAALASVAGFTTALILSMHYSKYFFSYSIPRENYKLIAAGIVSMLIAALVRSSISDALPEFLLSGDESWGIFFSKGIYLLYIISLIFLSGLLFLFLALPLKCFHRDDLILMKKAMQKASFPSSLILCAETIFSYGVRRSQ